MRTTTMNQAIRLAVAEVAAGRNVMLLFPDRSWTGGAPLMTNPKGSHSTVYVRCTTYLSGLKSVAIDTLILVAPDDPAWDAAGEAFARERLRTSLDPRERRIA